MKVNVIQLKIENDERYYIYDIVGVFGSWSQVADYIQEGIRESYYSRYSEGENAYVRVCKHYVRMNLEKLLSTVRKGGVKHFGYTHHAYIANVITLDVDENL